MNKKSVLGKNYNGWKRSLPDVRDKKYVPKTTIKTAKFFQAIKLAAHIDLRNSFMPAIYDQGDLGSCVSNAVAGAFEYTTKALILTDFMPSRLFIYYNGRVIEGTVGSDSGLTVRDGVKVVNNQGVCPEVDWSYNINQFEVQPTSADYTLALNTKITQYLSVAQNVNTIKAALSEGYPVIIGISVYESFEGAVPTATGVIPIPSPNEELLGGHCIVLVGYDDPSQRFIFRNSWGTSWGASGYGTIPYSYIGNADLAGDFWLISAVTGANPNPTTTSTTTSSTSTTSTTTVTPGPVIAELEALKTEINTIEGQLEQSSHSLSIKKL